eukprot:UN34899
MCSDDWKSSCKIAAFDIDTTLVKTKSGKKFPKTAADWVWLYDDDIVTENIQQLNRDGFGIVMFTNHKGVSNGRLSLVDMKMRIRGIAGGLNVPCTALAATGDDLYRKPHTGMWEYFQKELNDNKSIDKSSFFVGDAAGRMKDWKYRAPADHSASDRKFAWNCNLTFRTPEVHFLGYEDTHNINVINLKELVESKVKLPLPFHREHTQELVLFVGIPGSGKTYCYENYFKPYKYIHINRDTLKTMDKCKKMCKEVLDKGLSAVIDNTNYNKNSRRPYIREAKSRNIDIRCFGT